MADFTQIVPVSDLLDSHGIVHRGQNLEDIYTHLCGTPELDEVCAELERIVSSYFSSLALPETPSLYDHLILSLRGKDVIATSNWDPFLIRAARRSGLASGEIPLMLFLHGNVLAGFCQRDLVFGVRGTRCSTCGQIFSPSKLLYPVGNKDYNADPMIANAWRAVQEALRRTFMVTVFGYSAPQSDAAAIRLFLDAWGDGAARQIEHFEIIDIRPPEDLRKQWAPFIHTHHYSVLASPYDSWMFKHPRRTGEAYRNQYLKGMFIDDNPIPREASFETLTHFYAPLLEVERATPSVSESETPNPPGGDSTQ